MFSRFILCFIRWHYSGGADAGKVTGKKAKLKDK
jgi:hypothetical protein